MLVAELNTKGGNSPNNNQITALDWAQRHRKQFNIGPAHLAVGWKWGDGSQLELTLLGSGEKLVCPRPDRFRCPWGRIPYFDQLEALSW